MCWLVLKSGYEMRARSTSCKMLSPTEAGKELRAQNKHAYNRTTMGTHTPSIVPASVLRLDVSPVKGGRDQW
ncbi:hypothetical protein EVAR_69203_1 [Eumeta japonica]|uniref:Uncharacterized protein n=1 Tax=Eumeta variegata TaxID=151549 RepID=A0A4C2ABI9_EUMVA|nr:hypothetical protein EVAR_69203_1 [Eumeta japonica]